MIFFDTTGDIQQGCELSEREALNNRTNTFKKNLKAKGSHDDIIFLEQDLNCFITLNKNEFFGGTKVLKSPVHVLLAAGELKPPRELPLRFNYHGKTYRGVTNRTLEFGRRNIKQQIFLKEQSMSNLIDNLYQICTPSLGIIIIHAIKQLQCKVLIIDNSQNLSLNSH